MKDSAKSLRDVRKRKFRIVRLNRRTRVVLLASSYLDACEQEKGDFIRGGKAGSRSLLRSSKLWRDGSYSELERALNLLRIKDRKKYKWFWQLYVAGSKVDVAPHKLNAAVQGLSFVVAHMPDNIYVPVEVSENGGCLPSEALTGRRPRRAA